MKVAKTLIKMDMIKYFLQTFSNGIHIKWHSVNHLLTDNMNGDMSEVHTYFSA
jgi:hypothetical protein